MNPKILNKSLKNIKLKTFKDGKVGQISVFVSQISDWVYSFKKIKCLKIRFPTDAMGPVEGLL